MHLQHLLMPQFADIFDNQATDDLRAEKDRRIRLEEALRSARVCVRCGHPRVFITGNKFANFFVSKFCGQKRYYCYRQFASYGESRIFRTSQVALSKKI